MKNILSETNKKEIEERLNKISPDDEALWGKMNAGQALCHMADQLRLSTGEIISEYAGNIMSTTVVKFLVLIGMPAPKGKVKTMKELDQEADGTRPTDFENDRKILAGLIDRFSDFYPDNKKIEHPVFGKMNKKQWGRLAYIHLDYHLSQFGR